MNIYFQNANERTFGTYPLTGNELRDSMMIAAEVGYRSFDTAQLYENEEDTGLALAELNLRRDEICVTTKVHPDSFTEESFLSSVEESLKKLKLDYVDALLLHWPPIGEEIAQSLILLEQAKNAGLAKNIGVSNYTAQMMRDSTKIIEARLVTNQVEFHPLLNQDILLAAAVETGIPLSSYCSVARGEVFKHAIFGEIGKGYGKTAAQVVLRWILQKGVSINTMSTKRANIEANFNVMDFTLSNIDMQRIDEMTQQGYRIVGEDLVPWAPKWD